MGTIEKAILVASETMELRRFLGGMAASESPA